MYYEFRVGSVLGRGFSVFFQNLLPFLILGFIIYVPILLYSYHFFTTANFFDPGSLYRYLAISLLGREGVILVASAMMMYGVFQQLRGHPAPLGASVAGGLQRLFPVLGVGILVLLCLVGTLLPMIFVAAGLGLVALLYVPVVLLVYCMLWVSVPVAVAEKPGLFAALRRSAELTKGHRLGIFGIILLLGVIFFALQKLVEVSFTNVSSLTTGLILSAVIDVLKITLTAVIAAVTYHDLRLAKDGIDVGELEAVFD